MPLNLIREKEIEMKLRKAIVARKGYCFKFAVAKGSPDRVCLLPGRRIYFVETKRPKGGVLAPIQKAFHKICLETLGFKVFVISDTFDLDGFLSFIDNDAH